jgi:hypothetical protein
MIEQAVGRFQAFGVGVHLMGLLGSVQPGQVVHGVPVGRVLVNQADIGEFG